MSQVCFIVVFAVCCFATKLVVSKGRHLKEKVIISPIKLNIYICTKYMSCLPPVLSKIIYYHQTNNERSILSLSQKDLIRPTHTFLASSVGLSRHLLSDTSII